MTAFDQFSTLTKNLNLNSQQGFAAAITAMRQSAVNNPRMGARLKSVAYIFTLPLIPKTELDPLPPIFNSPKILVPANPNRIGVVLGGVFQQAIAPPDYAFLPYYSYGYPAAQAPITVNGGPPPRGATYGLPVPGVVLLTLAGSGISSGPLGNGTTSTDDIWVTLSPAKSYNDFVGVEDIMPGFIIAYEQTLAIEAGQFRDAA